MRERLRAEDQAAGLRRRLRDLRKTRGGPGRARPPVVAVASGKGGVGKTVLSVALSLALREAEKRVLLLDLDPGLADADILLGVHPERTLEECAAQGLPLGEALLEGPGGLLLLPGGSGMEELAEPGGFERIGLWKALEEMGPGMDALVFDTGAGISGPALAPLRRADLVLLVTTPQPAALADAYALYKILHREGLSGRVRLVVNRAGSSGEALLTATRIRKVSDRFLGVTPEFLGWIPESPLVAESARRRRPFLLERPDCGPSRAVRALAARVLEVLSARGEAEKERPVPPEREKAGPAR